MTRKDPPGRLSVDSMAGGGHLVLTPISCCRNSSSFVRASRDSMELAGATSLLFEALSFWAACKSFTWGAAGRSPSSEVLGRDERPDLRDSQVCSGPATGSRSRCIPSTPSVSAPARQCAHQSDRSSRSTASPSPIPLARAPPGSLASSAATSSSVIPTRCANTMNAILRRTARG